MGWRGGGKQEEKIPSTDGASQAAWAAGGTKERKEENWESGWINKTVPRGDNTARTVSPPSLSTPKRRATWRIPGCIFPSTTDPVPIGQHKKAQKGKEKACSPIL